MKDIKVIILAGGDSSRLWPFSDKHLFRFVDKPLVYYPIKQLINFGFTDITIVANKNNLQRFGELSEIFDKKIVKLMVQTCQGGISGALLSAGEIIEGNKVLLVGPSDIFEDSLLTDFKELIINNPEGLIAGKTVESYYPGGYLIVQNGKVMDIVEKPDKDKVPGNIVNLMFHYFSDGSKLIKKIKQSGNKNEDVYEIAINKLIKEGSPVAYIPYKGYWGFLKYPWHILDVTSYFLCLLKPKICGSVIISKTAAVSGKVYFGEGVRVMDNAKVVGPCFIGKNSVIGDNALVRESMIGENTLIGYTTEIARSYIGNNCLFHHNYIGDSVIGNNVSMGAGAVLANYRLDGKNIEVTVEGKKINTLRNKLGALVGDNVRIGINTSIMPGKKIGKNSDIVSASLVDTDVPEEKYFYQDRRNIILKNKRNR